MTGSASRPNPRSLGAAEGGYPGAYIGLMLAWHVDPQNAVAPFTASKLLTGWTFEPVPLAIIVAVGAGYLYGVAMLRRRGDAWPPGRTVAFVGLGLGSALIATQSALAAYDTTLLSLHMAQHMILSMLTPLMLALGAPITLALRSLRQRPRRLLVRLLHSRAAKVACFPPLGFALFVASPWALYFSSIYEATIRNEVLHNALHLHFVLVGSVFFWPLVGVDPVPGRLPYALRMLMTLLTLPFHAFLGVTLMGAAGVIAEDWYGAVRDWAPSPQRDQYIAGGLLWGAGDLIGLLFFGVLFVQWVRESDREARRIDRHLDRLEAAQRRSAADATE